jgi:type IV secretion system protein VirB4
MPLQRKTDRRFRLSDYDDSIAQTAVEWRKAFFDAKADRLYEVAIFYCIVLEGARSKRGILPSCYL